MYPCAMPTHASHTWHVRELELKDLATGVEQCAQHVGCGVECSGTIAIALDVVLRKVHLSTRPFNTTFQHDLSTRPFNTTFERSTFQHDLSTRPFNTTVPRRTASHHAALHHTTPQATCRSVVASTRYAASAEPTCVRARARARARVRACARARVLVCLGAEKADARELELTQPFLLPVTRTGTIIITNTIPTSPQNNTTTTPPHRRHRRQRRHRRHHNHIMQCDRATANRVNSANRPVRNN